MEFGYEGLGLFYTALEKLANQEKPIKTEVLKTQLKVGKRLDKCWKFMESLGILSSNNGETFNKQLLNFSEKYQIKKQKSAERIKQWRENQEVTENVTDSVHVSNSPKDNISKVKLSKGNSDEIKNLIFPFDSKEFKLSWEVLIKTKKWRKKEFPALQATLKKLSNYPEQDAIQMIENAIAGEYQGVFPIDKKQTNGQQISKTGTHQERFEEVSKYRDNLNRNTPSG